MVNIALTGLYLFGAIFLIALVGVFDALDKLIEHEYESHRDAWEHDGCPRGILFRPAEAKFFRGSFALQRCALVWPFSTPPWTREDMRAKSLLRRFRLLFFMLYAALFVSILSLCSYLSLTVTI
jgi:hypothetical protein